MPVVLVPAERVARWVGNFTARHGDTALTVAGGALAGQATDGSTFAARLPFDQEYAGPPGADAFAAAVHAPEDWGVLLVRKGGFAIGRLRGGELTDSKVGQRHVQGRTKAGGQSQQRFARRRDNQARQAYEAAAEHAARILGGLMGPLVTGGDHGAVDEVLTDARLSGAARTSQWLAVPDPKRGVLEQAVRDAQAAQIEVENR